MRWQAAWIILLASTTAFAQKEFGFDNQKSSGQPYLSPAETVKRMKVPAGFSVKLFAAEPMMTNPIAMAIDSKGRVWIIESFEYPKRTPRGKTPRDRIVILEDTDGDGLADKRTVFAEGKDFPVTPERAAKGLGAFDMASGLEVGYDGCFIGAPPYFWHVRDTKSSGKADTFEIVASGFGSQDTHETLNTFTWGPDGWLYGLHGVFTESKVIPGPASSEHAIDLDAGVWRYHPTQKKFEVFAEGTSNPWGMDFNKDGECFLCCCVIPHLFHIVPSGIYIKQGSKPSYNPYAYGALKEICDHTFHKESGWAHAGLLSLDVKHMPVEYQKSLIFGSIHGCSIKRNTLKPHGSTYIGSKAEDFLISGDRNFRPIQLRWAPDGSILVSDWHDQNPCHQTKPDDWDYDRGRIYRIVPPIQLDSGKAADNPFWKKMSYQSKFNHAMSNGTSLAQPYEKVLKYYQESDQEHAKAIRTLESPVELREHTSALIKLAGLRQIQHSLAAVAEHRLVQHDPIIPFLLWLAVVKEVSLHRDEVLQWLLLRAPYSPVIRQHLLARVTRRLAASGSITDLNACLKFIMDSLNDDCCLKSLSGLSEAMKGRKVREVVTYPDFANQLKSRKQPEIDRVLRSLAGSFHDRTAIAHYLKTLQDQHSSASERKIAIQELAFMEVPEAKALIVRTLSKDTDETVRVAAARHLAGFEDPALGADMLQHWKDLSPSVRFEVINTLRSRKPWARALLLALGDKIVSRKDLNDNVALAIRQFKDKELDTLLEKHFGAFRDSPAELAVLLSKLKKEVPSGSGDVVRGKAVFTKHCMPCHRFEGQGHDVGPHLDGAERSLDYLLVNIVDPNRVVGTPYFSRTIVLKNGKLITGILVEEDGTTIRLKRDNAVIDVVAKAEIEEQTTSTKSLMPEGLSNNLSVQDLRDLIRYLQPVTRK